MEKKNEEQSLKDVLQQMLEHYKLKGKLNNARVKSLWHQLMGPAISKHTIETKIYRQKLFVTLDSPALRNELYYGRDKICRMLNEELGEAFLEEVVIR